MSQLPSYKLELRVNPEAERITARLMTGLEKIKGLLADSEALILKLFENLGEAAFKVGKDLFNVVFGKSDV